VFIKPLGVALKDVVQGFERDFWSGHGETFLGRIPQKASL
jgi:hypothetical protein